MRELTHRKVIFSETGSNRTIEHIIQESPLIELYRDRHVTIENGFHLEHWMIRHSHPDMTKTLRRLHAAIVQCSPHSFRAGRRSKMCIPDHIAVSMDATQKAKDPMANEGEDEPAEVESADFMDDD